jgi:hypothetical protein
LQDADGLRYFETCVVKRIFWSKEEGALGQILLELSNQEEKERLGV